MSSKQRSPSSDSSSSSESEKEQAPSPPPAKKPSLKSTSPKTKPSKSPQPPSSDDEEDEDGEPPVSQKKKKPAASGTKRQRDSFPTEPKHTKKKKLFERIWTMEDEIKILKTIKAFYSDKGLSNTISAADLDAIHSSLGLEFTKGQLGRKIRDLRMKFQINASQGKSNTDLKFSNPHQHEIYELSKKIWLPEEVYIPEGGLWRAVAKHGGISWALIQRVLNLVDPEKARALEKRFFQLELAKMRHCLQWLDKKEETIQLVSDGMKKSG